MRPAPTRPRTKGDGFGDEALEEAGVLGFLGVPEDADGERSRRILECLERAVLGASGDGETLPQTAVALMVVRLHVDPVAEEVSEPRTFGELDRMFGEHARRLLVPVVADEIGHVLLQIAAERDVQHLRPTTDGQHGQVPVERFHQTMAREWAYGLAYRSHRHRNAALPHWLDNYNHRRLHSSIGDRPPISRVHNVRG